MKKVLAILALVGVAAGSGRGGQLVAADVGRGLGRHPRAGVIRLGQHGAFAGAAGTGRLSHRPEFLQWAGACDRPGQ